jgi:four helix bundle protein
MNEVAEQLKERSLRFAVNVTRACRSFPSNWEGQHVADQLFRSATSVGANYSASCRARTRREFIAKLGLVLEESDETVFWLKLAIRSGLRDEKDLTALLTEARELLAIFTASVKTASANYSVNRQ